MCRAGFVVVSRYARAGGEVGDPAVDLLARRRLHLGGGERGEEGGHEGEAHGGGGDGLWGKMMSSKY